jgi:two-component sensor histidine kinase
LPADSIPEDPAQLDIAKSVRLDQRYKGLQNPGVNLIHILGDKIWWVTTDSLFAYSLDQQQGTAFLSVNRKLPAENYNAVNSKSHLIADPRNNMLIWVGLTQYGQLDTETGEFLFLRTFPAFLTYPGPLSFDSDGYLWLNSFEAGIFRLLPKEGKLFDIRRSEDQDINIGKHYKCKMVLEDKYGNLWLASSGYGLFKQSIVTSKFGYFGNNHFGPSLAYLYPLPSNEIAFAIQRNDIYLFDKKQNTARKFISPSSLLPKGTKMFDCSFYYEDQGIFCVLPYQYDNKKWTFRLNAEGHILEQIPPDSVRSHYLQANQYLFQEKDTLWRANLSTDNEHGGSLLSLAKFTKNYEFLEEYSTQMDNKYMDHRWCSAFSKDWIWVGYTNTGLAGFNRKTKQWRQYVHHPSDTNSLCSNQLLCLLPDPQAPDSILWIGTAAGLNKLDIREDIFTHYGSKDSFPNEVIYGILADSRHHFWISSNNGLFVFDPRTKAIVRQFKRDDGLQHTEFNYASYAKGRDGTFYFGGVGGLTYFNPDDFFRETPPTHLSIKGIRIFNKKVEFSRDPAFHIDHFRLDKPLSEMEEIIFKPTHRMITFEFALLDLTQPSINRYRYKLEGFSDDWVNLGHQNEATFTNLDPGHYTLWVQACNHAGVWNEKGASIRFTILAPWWKTWWFRLFLFMASVGLIFLYFLNRERQKSSLQTLRNRISQDIHDEIGSTLTSISLFGVVAQKSLQDGDSVAAKMLARINESTTQVVESISDIIWTINSENDNIGDLINRMRAYTANIVETGHWNILFHYDEALRNINLNMVQRRNVYLIFKEAINNAVKYSEGNTLDIQFQKNDDYFVLTIQDNGQGFQADGMNTAHKLGGNGIKNMQRRAAELKGTLNIVAQEGAGTKVIFRFNHKLKVKQ